VRGGRYIRSFIHFPILNLHTDAASLQDPTHLRTLFQRAVARHMQYSAWAADGQGVDRHLFGLKKSLREGEEVPALYTDEAFAKSSHWELSTSQLSSPWFDGWGYGEGESLVSTAPGWR
jgi:carnitine O-acetyltransferase